MSGRSVTIRLLHSLFFSVTLWNINKSVKWLHLFYRDSLLKVWKRPAILHKKAKARTKGMMNECRSLGFAMYDVWRPKYLECNFEGDTRIRVNTQSILELVPSRPQLVAIFTKVQVNCINHQRVRSRRGKARSGIPDAISTQLPAKRMSFWSVSIGILNSMA